MTDKPAPSAADTTLILSTTYIVQAMLRGIAACSPHIRLEKVLIMACAIAGQQIARMIVADDISTYKCRKMCKEAFCKAIDAEPAVKPAEPPPAASIGSLG